MEKRLLKEIRKSAGLTYKVCGNWMESWYNIFEIGGRSG